MYDLPGAIFTSQTDIEIRTKISDYIYRTSCIYIIPWTKAVSIVQAKFLKSVFDWSMRILTEIILDILPCDIKESTIRLWNMVVQSDVYKNKLFQRKNIKT